MHVISCLICEELYSEQTRELIKHHVLTSKFLMTSAVLEHLVKIGQTRLDDK